MKNKVSFFLLICFVYASNLFASNPDSLNLGRINTKMTECMQMLGNGIKDFSSDAYLKETKKTAKKLTLLASQYEKLTNDSTVRVCSFLGETLLSMVYNAREDIDSAYVHAQSALSLYHPYGKYMCEADSSKAFYQFVFGCDGLIGIEREMCVKKNDIKKALYYCQIINDSCSFYKFDLERVQSYIRQGEIFEQINDYENAIDSHIKALDLRLKHPCPSDYPLTSQIYNGLLEVITRLYSRQKLLIDNETLKQKFEVISNFIDWNEFFKRHPLDFCEEEENAGQTFWICALFNTYIRLLKDLKQYETLLSMEEGLNDFYTRNFGKESIEYAEHLMKYSSLYNNYSNVVNSDDEKDKYRGLASEKEKLALETWKSYFEKNPIYLIAVEYQKLDKEYALQILKKEEKFRLYRILLSYTQYMSNLCIYYFDNYNYDMAYDAVSKAINIKENVLKDNDNAILYRYLGGTSIMRNDLINAEDFFNKSYSLAYEEKDTLNMAEANLGLTRLYSLNNQSKARQKLSEAYKLVTGYSYHSIEKSDILETMAIYFKEMYDYNTAYGLMWLSAQEKKHCGQKLLDEDYVHMADFMPPSIPLHKDSVLFAHIIEIATKDTFSHSVLKASELLGSYYIVYLNEYEKAVLYFNRAAKVAHELRDSVSEAKCLAEIGTILFAGKNYEEAFVYMKNAEQVNPNLKYQELLSLMAYIPNDSIVNMRLPYLYNNTKVELKKKMLSTNTNGREMMVNLMPYDVLKSMVFYYPNLNVCTDIAYNATLLFKGLLQNTQKSISEYIANSNDEVLKKQFSRLQMIRNESFVKSGTSFNEMTKNRLESTYLEMSILEELSKRHLISNFEITYDKVSKKLDNNDVAIEFVEINRLEPFDRSAFCYGALILRKGYRHPVFVRLESKKEIDDNIDVLLNAFNFGSRLTVSKWKTISENLYKEIWGQLVNYISPGDDVYFSVAGKLHMAPIEVLSDTDGVLANEKFNLFRVSSTRELCKKGNRRLSSVALYGGLKYDSLERSKSEREYKSDFCFPSDSIFRSGWDFLPSTLVEVRQIASKLDSLNIPTMMYEGDKGTEYSFRNLSGKDISILHIATHGFYFNPKELYVQHYFTSSFRNVDSLSTMKRTGLILSGGQSAWLGTKKFDQKNDGVLLADEIASLDLSHTNLVVLSACQTGLGSIDKNGEGVFGIQRALKLAGVNSIIMTLGKVDDKASQLFMNCFYDKLFANNDINSAFRAAQDFVKNYEYEVDGIKMNYKNPRYWAPFILLDAIN